MGLFWEGICETDLVSSWGLKHRAERKLFCEPLHRTQYGHSVAGAAGKTGQPCLSHHAVRGHCCLVAKLCPTLCDPMDCSLFGFPVLRYLLEFAQTHVH